MDTDRYEFMIKKFLEADYVFCDYITASTNNRSSSFVISRHDVDFSLRGALAIAKIENGLAVKSTYFFHLKSPLYNILSRYAVDVVRAIHELGHEIALHFDISVIPHKLDQDLAQEIALFREVFPFANDKIVSFHRVGNRAFDLGSLSLPNGILHTYQDNFFKDIVYYSDSGGAWKYGDPIDSENFQQRKSMQILTHPMWWTEDGTNPYQKLSSYLKNNREQSIDFLEQTVISYSLSQIRN